MICENTLKITEYTLLGKLPDPFLFDNGSRVKSPEDWELRRKEIYRTAVELQYGVLPPSPEVFSVEPLYISKGHSSYKITAGTREKQVSFRMKLILPENAENCPVIVDGDLCFGYAMSEDYLNSALKKGVAWAFFDRTELAHDISSEGRGAGALYEIYGDCTFGALGAWAWGYSRIVDALERLYLPQIDLSCIVFSGHSRGGKTAMLAGVTDSRAAIVNPNETCAGSCGCYRIHMKGISPDGKERRSEQLSDLWKNFGFWVGPEMERYAENEESLPFDSHFLKALVAPRILFVSEAAGDIWANPVGSWQTSLAAKEVYKLLGAEENLTWYFREGTHFHTAHDIEMLVEVIRRKKFGEPLSDEFEKLPFPPIEKAFDWSAPI